MADFDKEWNSMKRMLLVPGKETIGALNAFLQAKYRVSVTPSQIVAHLRKDEVPTEMVELIEEIDQFRRSPVD